MISRVQQVTDTILMIRPSQFGFNAETAHTNIFQKSDSAVLPESIHQRALEEFDEFVKTLRENRLYVIVLQSTKGSETPDAIFPNNWISFHYDQMIIFPMLAKSRRRERKVGWINMLKKELGMNQIVDLTGYENDGRFLEGTGSLVLDRLNRIAYANLSSRTDPSLAREFAKKINYEIVLFMAKDQAGKEIYHTNVMMAIGIETAVICSEAIADKRDRQQVHEKLAEHHHVIQLSFQQMLNFAGNMLLVRNRDGKHFWVMSKQAFESMTPSQLESLRKDGEFIYSPLTTIETFGGGSARCMMCEII